LVKPLPDQDGPGLKTKKKTVTGHQGEKRTPTGHGGTRSAVEEKRWVQACAGGDTKRRESYSTGGDISKEKMLLSQPPAKRHECSIVQLEKEAVHTFGRGLKRGKSDNNGRAKLGVEQNLPRIRGP